MTNSLLKIVAWMSAESKKDTLASFNHFKEYTPRPKTCSFGTVQRQPKTTPPKSQSSHNRYGLWFQNSSLIMSQCCSAILVDSCLVLRFLGTLGDATSSSAPMET